MKASTYPARVAAWLNMLDHCEAQLQALGALSPMRAQVREARGIVKANAAKRTERTERAKMLREEIARLRARVDRLQECLRVAAVDAASLFGAKKLSEERRLELLALAQALGCDCVPHKMLEAVKTLQVAASAEGNECVRVRLPRVGGPQVSLDGVTWHDQKTGRKV